MSRERLRPWLERVLDSGQCEGVEWVDRSRQVFQVPWTHHSSHGYRDAHGDVFRRWAQHTGEWEMRCQEHIKK